MPYLFVFGDTFNCVIDGSCGDAMRLKGRKEDPIVSNIRGFLAPHDLSRIAKAHSSRRVRASAGSARIDRDGYLGQHSPRSRNPGVSACQHLGDQTDSVTKSRPPAFAPDRGNWSRRMKRAGVKTGLSNVNLELAS